MLPLLPSLLHLVDHLMFFMFNVNISWEPAQSISALQDLTTDIRYCFIQAQVSTLNPFPFISVCRFSVFFNPDGFCPVKNINCHNY